MAQKVVLSDDLDGSTDSVDTVTYEVDGTEYKIDLSKENQGILEDRLKYLREAKEAYERAVSALWEFREKSSPVRASSTPRKRGSAVYGDYTTQQIREWAKGQGIEVSSKGKLPEDLIEKHKAAHSS